MQRPPEFRRLLTALLLTACSSLAAEGDGTLVFAGTGNSETSQGIRAFKLQTSNLEVSQNITLVPLGLAAETANPSYLEVDVRRRLLFAVNAVAAGTVSSFSVGSDGKLTLVNQSPSLGAMPCHFTLDKEGRHLLVVNCGHGSMALIPVGTDGKLGAAALVPSTGARSVAFDPANRFVFVCEKDRIAVYRFDATQGKLTPAEQPYVATKPDTNPIRIVFRPDGRFAYVVNEKSSTVTAYAYNQESGALAEGESVSTLPGYYDGPNTSSEIGMHPSGKFLYVSNQGHNSVVLFSIDPASGAVSYLEEQGTGGKNPVHFGIQPSAQHLAIANRDSNTLLVARIDADNGRLKPSGLFASMPAPSCVRFLPPAQ
jgi:6-phosphogluconolactonase